MGLKMPGDEEVLANKIFLNRAATRSKAKSWLSVSSGGEAEGTASFPSRSDDQVADDDLSTIQISDELSGVGMVSKAGQDDPSNRQLMSANEALRRKLLSKDAYKKYNDGKRGGLDASRPGSRKKEAVEDYEEEEAKGKSIRQTQPPIASNDDGSDQNTAEASVATVLKPVPRSKKRPSTYLDELLAGRRSKQQKKAKRSDSND